MTKTIKMKRPLKIDYRAGGFNDSYIRINEYSKEQDRYIDFIEKELAEHIDIIKAMQDFG